MESEAVAIGESDISRQILGDKLFDYFSHWSVVYKRMNLGFSFPQGLVIPSAEFVDRHWPIVVAQGVTSEQALAQCQKDFPCWKCEADLDKALSHNDRQPTESYVGWVKSSVEPDENLKGFSAEDLRERQIEGNTLTEAILLQYWHFIITGEHLNEINWNLCAGSRFSVGGVPGVGWRGGGFGVGWCSPRYAFSDLRARAVVSLLLPAKGRQ